MNDVDPIADSIRRRTARISTVAPDFGDVLDQRQQRTRRRAGAATIGLLALGVGGLFALSSTGGPVTGDLADAPVDSALPPSTLQATAGMPTDALWYCEGRVDHSLAPSVEGTVAPTMPVPTTTAPAGFEPDDTVPPFSLPDPAASAEHESGFFRSCVMVDEFVGTVTTIVETVPADTAFPEPTTTVLAMDDEIVQATTPADVPVTGPADARVDGAQTYTVQPGDFPLDVADVFCINVDDLYDYNGFVDGSEWPFPGDEVSIPPQACPGPAEFTAPATLPDSVTDTTAAATVPPSTEG